MTTPDTHEGFHVTHTDAHLLWLDYETTGLEIGMDLPLEFTAQITTLADPQTLLAQTGPHVIGSWVGDVWLPTMDLVVHEMHSGTGLLAKLARDGVSEQFARMQLAQLAMEWGEQYETMLAGSGVHFDRDLCNDRWGGDVLEPLYYRVIDVSVLRETSRSADGPVYERTRPHSSEADLNDARAELAFYQRVMRGDDA